MTFDQEKVASWLLATLATDPQDRATNIRQMLKDMPQSLKVGIQNTRDLEEFLGNLEYREYPLIHSDGQWIRITGDGLLEFSKLIDPISDAIRDKKKYEKIIDSSEVSEKIKKDLKDFLKSLKGKFTDDITAEIISYVSRGGKDTLWEILRILFEFKDFGSS